MDSEGYQTLQKFLERELNGVNESIRNQFTIVLRAVTELSTDVKEIENRLRTIEVTTTQVITQLQSDVNMLKQGEAKLELDIGDLRKQQNEWAKYIKATADETIMYTKELFVDADAYAADKFKMQEETAKRWKEQTSINEKNNMARGAIWAVFIIILGGVITLIIDLITHGGVYGLAKSWGLGP